VECKVLDSHDRWLSDSLTLNVNYECNHQGDYCSYNGDEGCVEINLPANNDVTKYYIMRYNLTKEYLERVGFVEYRSDGIVINESIKDYGVTNLGTYKYYIFGCDEDAESDLYSRLIACPKFIDSCVYVSNEVSIKEKSYYIYDLDEHLAINEVNIYSSSRCHTTVKNGEVWKIEYSTESGDYSQNLQIQYQETFGRYQKVDSK
jgi:hypothetical protein